MNNALGLDFAEPVETYSTSPHLYTALGIPEGTRGVLPHAKRSRAGLAAEEIEDIGETGRPRGRGGHRERTRTRQRRRTRGGREVTVSREAADSLGEPADLGEEPSASRPRREPAHAGALRDTATTTDDHTNLDDHDDLAGADAFDDVAGRPTNQGVNGPMETKTRTEPERIVPPDPFTVIFRAPDLGGDDGDVAPSAASERSQQRRRGRSRGSRRG
jgi:hypothetical protein